MAYERLPSAEREVRQMRDTVDNCLRGSSVIHHVCQAVQMSMAVSKKGWECYFEEWLLSMHLIQQIIWQKDCHVPLPQKSWKALWALWQESSQDKALGWRKPVPALGSEVTQIQPWVPTIYKALLIHLPRGWPLLRPRPWRKDEFTSIMEYRQLCRFY